MAENSNISWTTHTFNPWRGCTKISDGCKFCYAEMWAHRNPAVLGEWGPNGTRVVAAEAQWREPVRWNRQAGSNRVRVFCASLADIFEGPETMPASDFNEVRTHCLPILGNDQVAFARNRLFNLIDQTPNLDWLLLTKRPQNVTPLYGAWLHWTLTIARRPVEYPPNVWIGASVENHECAVERIPHLLRIPARVRFLSCEPLLGPLDLRPWLDQVRGVQWVIVGGESGSEARPFDPDWARFIVDQCQDAGVPCWVKQMGSNPVGLTLRKKGDDINEFPAELRVQTLPC